MNEYAIAAIGEDRPGIVAALSSALRGVDASIEDSSMTILGGHFAMLLLVQGELDQTQLQDAVAPVGRDLGLMVEIRQTEPAAGSGGSSAVEHVVAAYGPDRPGLVTALAATLADAQANITNFGSRATEGGVFAMWFNVVIPAGIDVADLEAELRRVGSELQLDVSLRAVDVEEL